MATTIIASVGTRGSGSDIGVTVSSVSGSGTPWSGTVTLSAAVPSTVNIGDRLDDSSSNDYLITGISGSDLTCTEHPFASAGTAPATGAANVRRAYGSLANADAALPSDLTTEGVDGEQWEFELYNDGEFNEQLAIGSHTTDSTHKIIWRAASGESFMDHASAATNALKYNQTNGVGISNSPFLGGTIEINVGSVYVEFEGLQVKSADSGSWTVKPSSASSAPVWKFDNCIFEGTSTGSARVCEISGSGTKIVNCLVVNRSTGDGLRLVEGADADHVTAACPAAQTNTGTGIVENYGNPIATNCASFGYGTSFGSAGFGWGTSSNNAADDANAPGTSNQDSKTYADQFEDDEDDWRLKSGSDCEDNGTGSVSTDIIGQSRSSPDIGCWEFQAAGGGLGIPIAAHHYKQLAGAG